MPTDTRYYNPIRGGISLVSADSPQYLGTLGVVLRDATDVGNYFLVTALHVLMGGEKDIVAGLQTVKGGGRLLHPIFGPATNVVAQWTTGDVINQSRFRCPNVGGGETKRYEDYVALECDAGWANDAHVGWITGVGKATAPVMPNVGDTLVLRGARTGQATWCTVLATDTMTGASGPYISVKTASGMPFRGVEGDAATLGGDSGAVAVRKSDRALVGLVKGVDKRNPGVTLLTPMIRIMQYCKLVL